MDHSIETEIRQQVIPARHLVFIGLAIAALVAAMVFLSFEMLVLSSGQRAGATAPPSSRLASAPGQTNVGGNVTMVVSWQGPEAGPVFGLAMDTHSVDLDAYDLSRMAVLHTNDGRETQAIGWDAPAGGHHRKGTLTFSEVAIDGRPFITDSTESIELVIYDLSGVPARSFTWELK